MRALRTDVDKRWEPLSMLRGPPHAATEEPVGHRAGHAGGSLLRDRGVRAGPAAVDGVSRELNGRRLGAPPAGRADLEGAVLLLRLLGVEPADSPRVRSTIDTVARRPGAGFPLPLPPGNDGLAGTKGGAFLPRSFWLVPALPAPDEPVVAPELLTELCALGSPLGLYGEEIDPASHRRLGNYPQARTDAALPPCRHDRHGIAGSAWVWPDNAWIAVITSVVISRRRWRRLPA
jgi:hypothetical protein